MMSYVGKERGRAMKRGRDDYVLRMPVSLLQYEWGCLPDKLSASARHLSGEGCIEIGSCPVSSGRDHTRHSAAFADLQLGRRASGCGRWTGTVVWSRELW